MQRRVRKLRIRSALASALAFGAALSARAEPLGTLRVLSGLASPTFATAPPGDTGRLFITERFGSIRILDLATGALRPSAFLSVAGPSNDGLQGLAFHPDYAANGYFYVYYYAAGQAHLIRYTRSAANPDLANPASAQPVIEIDKPHPNHNGGWVGFGPDGYLYLPVGDGGLQYDPDDHAQTLSGDLLGKVLRLDVDADAFPADPDRNYAIPPDNPFVGAPGDDEIWAYGLRNPYRSSFDRLTGDFYIADVGQDTREEIDFQPAASSGGENYGWRLREGSIATPAPGFGGPPPPGNVEPLYDYGHGSGPFEGLSVIGGVVYRGPVVSLRGRYFFADFDNARIWSLRHDGSQVSELLDWTDLFAPDAGSIDFVVAFGEDALGHVYIVDLDGELFRITGPGPASLPALSPPARLLIACLLLLTAIAARSRSRPRRARRARARSARAA